MTEKNDSATKSVEPSKPATKPDSHNWNESMRKDSTESPTPDEDAKLGKYLRETWRLDNFAGEETLLDLLIKCNDAVANVRTYGAALDELRKAYCSWRTGEQAQIGLCYDVGRILRGLKK